MKGRESEWPRDPRLSPHAAASGVRFGCELGGVGEQNPREQGHKYGVLDTSEVHLWQRNGVSCAAFHVAHKRRAAARTRPNEANTRLRLQSIAFHARPSTCTTISSSVVVLIRHAWLPVWPLRLRLPWFGRTDPCTLSSRTSRHNQTAPGGVLQLQRWRPTCDANPAPRRATQASQRPAGRAGEDGVVATVATVATATPRRAPSHGVAAVSHGRELV